MKEYLVCGCFFLIFTMLLYALGKAVDIKEESYSVKFIKGYLVYSFFVAIGGMSVQLFFYYKIQYLCGFSRSHFLFVSRTKKRITRIWQSGKLNTNLFEPFSLSARVSEILQFQGIFFFLFGSLVLQFLVRAFGIIENHVLVHRTSKV